jgi:DNA-binding CsgD family transcriptional regulator
MTTVLGFGLCRAWIVLCIGTATFGAISYAEEPQQGSLYLLAGAASSLVVALLAGRQQEADARTRAYLLRATLFLLLVAVLMTLLAHALELPILLLPALLSGGAGTGCLQALWGERFAAQPPRFSPVAAPAAAILTALLVAFASPATALIALTIFPLASFALLLIRAGSPFAAGLFWPRGRTPATRGQADAPENRELVPGLGDSGRTKGSIGTGRAGVSSADMFKLMASITIFSFLCRSYDVVLEHSLDSSALIGSGALLALIVVGTAFLLFALVAKGRFSATLIYRLSLPTMVIGLVILALFLDRFSAISFFIINVGYEFFDILTWILFAEIARRRGRSLRVFGLGVAFTFVGMALGYLLGPLVYDSLGQSGTQVASFSLLGIISLVVVAFLVIPEGTLMKLVSSRSPGASSGWLSDESPDAANERDAGGADSGDVDSFENLARQRADVMAKEYRLTARECEVLALLARGRTLSIIARNLQIANGTARTHIENVYAKLGVHKQQELIDLVEAYRERE